MAGMMLGNPQGFMDSVSFPTNLIWNLHVWSLPVGSMQVTYLFEAYPFEAYLYCKQLSQVSQLHFSYIYGSTYTPCQCAGHAWWFALDSRRLQPASIWHQNGFKQGDGGDCWHTCYTCCKEETCHCISKKWCELVRANGLLVPQLLLVLWTTRANWEIWPAANPWISLGPLITDTSHVFWGAVWTFLESKTINR